MLLPMTASAAPKLSPPIDLDRLREALATLPGIAEVRVADEHVWVMRADTDVQRDEDIVGVLLDVLPPEVEFHFAPAERAGMVPGGLRLL